LSAYPAQDKSFLDWAFCFLVSHALVAYRPQQKQWRTATDQRLVRQSNNDCKVAAGSKSMQGPSRGHWDFFR
jgi:hypothetical protein